MNIVEHETPVGEFSIAIHPAEDIKISVVLVWLYIIRFSFSKNASEEGNLVLVIVS